LWPFAASVAKRIIALQSALAGNGARNAAIAAA
jgi:hypothetical protein